jgi:hypothetical protein
MKKTFTNHIISYGIVLFLLIFLIMIEQTLSLSCQFVPIEYKAKFISKSDDYTLIENKQLIHWFYQRFIQMNIKFPWSKIFF